MSSNVCIAVWDSGPCSQRLLLSEFNMLLPRTHDVPEMQCSVTTAPTPSQPKATANGRLPAECRPRANYKGRGRVARVDKTPKEAKQPRTAKRTALARGLPSPFVSGAKTKTQDSRAVFHPSFLFSLLPCFLASLLPCFLASLLPCFLASLLPCFLASSLSSSHRRLLTAPGCSSGARSPCASRPPRWPATSRRRPSRGSPARRSP